MEHFGIFKLLELQEHPDLLDQRAPQELMEPLD